MATATQLANKFLADAQHQQDPEIRNEILRQGAYTFMGLAQNPKNARHAQKLAQMGLAFADAVIRPAYMDDFTDLLRETEEAWRQVGDEPQELIARRREIHEERTPLEKGQILITPATFTRDATLGRSAKIKFQPTVDEIAVGISQTQNVAFWQGTKKEAQAMTIDVSLGFLPPFPTTFGEVFFLPNVRPYAEVEFGSDGNRTKIRFDVSFGNRCTVPANYIAVTIGAGQPRTVGVTISDTVPITAGASIGAFAAPSAAPLISTAYVDQLNAGQTTNGRLTDNPLVNPLPIQIPLKAVQLLPLQSNLPLGGTAELTFFDYGGNIIATYFYLQAANNTTLPIPITGDVAFIQIKNTSGVAADFRFPFQLGM